MSFASSAARRKSFRLHRAILGLSLAASAFGIPIQRAEAQTITLTAASNKLTADNVVKTAAGVGVGDFAGGDAGDILDMDGKTLVMATFDLGPKAKVASITTDGAVFDVAAGNSVISTAVNGAGFTVNGGANELSLTTDAGNFTGTVNIEAGATLDLEVANAGAANYSLINASVLKIGVANALEDTSNVTLANTAILDVDFQDTIGTISSAAAGTNINLAAGVQLTFGEAADATYAGILTTTATSTLVKQGAGNQTFSLDNSATALGRTIINAGTITFGANNALGSATSITVNNGATLDLGGFASNNTVGTTAGATIKNGILGGTLNIQGSTIENITGNADLNLNSGNTTISGVNAFGDLAFNAGTATVALPTNGTVPITASGAISANGGQLNVDATGLTTSQIKGEKTIIAGTVPDAVASATTFTYAGSSQKFEAFNKPLSTPALYDVSLLKGSLVLSVKNKAGSDICGVTGLCSDGTPNGKLEGLDKSEVRSLYSKVVLPAIEGGKLDLPFWTTKPQMSKYLISGLMPRNIDAAGTVLSSYNDRMADTLFERLPLRQFDPVEVVEEEIVIEEVETKEPVRGLWKTTGQGEVIEANGKTYEEDPSLTAQYADRDNMRAWVRGFGGDVASTQTTRYLYKSYNATNAGGVVGVDYAAFDDFQIGVYANYGDLAINTDSNKLAGSGSWNPTGWGGGITADYWTDSYYLQGLFGASAFTGDQDRSIVAIGGDLGGGNTLSGEKNITSYVGALRAGAPMQVGSFYLEPQAQATWSGNQEDSFSEGGNTNFKLKYKSRETNFLQTELGIKVAYPIAMGKTQQLVPSIRVAWLGDWNMDNEGQKIGYRFSNKTIDLESNQQDQNGALLEGGLDYTVANIGATSFKVYGRGGAEVWDTERGTNWRASGGVTVQF